MDSFCAGPAVCQCQLSCLIALCYGSVVACWWQLSCRIPDTLVETVVAEGQEPHWYAIPCCFNARSSIDIVQAFLLCTATSQERNRECIQSFCQVEHGVLLPGWESKTFSEHGRFDIHLICVLLLQRACLLTHKNEGIKDIYTQLELRSQARIWILLRINGLYRSGPFCLRIS